MACTRGVVDTVSGVSKYISGADVFSGTDG